MNIFIELFIIIGGMLVILFLGYRLGQYSNAVANEKDEAFHNGFRDGALKGWNEAIIACYDAACRFKFLGSYEYNEDGTIVGYFTDAMSAEEFDARMQAMEDARVAEEEEAFREIIRDFEDGGF